MHLKPCTANSRPENQRPENRACLSPDFVRLDSASSPQGNPRRTASPWPGFVIGFAANNMFMKFRSHTVRLASVLAFATCVTAASGSILSVAGNDTLVGNRPANLITNGSFEADGGFAPNGAYWATGTALTPTMSLSAWTASGQSGSYAHWGNDGLGGIKFSAPLPDGTNGLYFGAGIMQLVAPWPVEANDGLVTFTSTPAILPKPTDGPVTLQQTVNGLNPSTTYVLDFWTSGENVGQPGLPVDGFFGLDITGEPTLYFAAPSGNFAPVGPSQRYQVYFIPTASTVTFKWSNWGHYMSPNGMSDELVLDDVILNAYSNSPTALDCSCLTNITLTCPANVPDLCALATSCFGTNMIPGSCTQNFPPGMPLTAGTYPVNVQVLDLQSNYFNCVVTITVLPPAPAPPLTVVCPTNKTVECGSGWSFDSPTILSSCCGVTITSTDNILSQTACSEVIERTWLITDGCGNNATCSQKVTTVDTTPPGRACGVNMVPNPSFERHTNCPSMISQLDFAAPWFTPSDGTSDLFSSCGGPWSSVSTPTNLAGYQIPQDGQAYAGAVVWSQYGLNTNNSYRDYREYLEVPLRATLVGGARYQVSFHVSRSDNRPYAVAEIGAYFSKLPLQTNGYSRNFNVVPQVENAATNLLLSTNTWMLVQGTFVATGNEEYLTLGNFRTDANTTWTNANPNAPLPDYAYYYFDDVSVTMLCDPITNKVVECGQPWDWDLRDQMFFDNCSGIGLTINTTTTTNNYCPTVITREWELTDACGNSNYFTQTITNVDTTTPKLQCVAGANLVPNPQFENKAYCPFYFSQVSAAAPWFNPTIATPDYMNACAPFWLMGVPSNAMGNQTAYSGNGYMGAFAYSVYGTNPVPGYREYIEAPLLAPMQPGMQYQVSFRVSLADSSGWSIGNIGAHFSVGALVNGSTQGPLNVVPQVANPPGNLLTNKTGWTLITGTFSAAGGETHITLGNFLDDAATTAITNAYGTNHTYYYYDDVEVVPLCAFTNKTVLCDSQWDFDPPLAYDECSGDYVSVFVATNWTSGLCPKTHTRVWTIYDACNNSMTATQSVTAVDVTAPGLLCSGLNLIPNPGFEDMVQCANGPSWLEVAQPWYMPTVGSSDLFNPCATLASGVSVPVNMFGSQTPFAGSSYGGGYVYAPGGAGSNSYREYLATPLIAPLIAGQAYAVSFRVSRADNMAYAVAEIGAHFSAGPLTNWPGSYLAVTPQVVNPSANIITSATNWTLISGTFTASGGEDHITLGNFFTDANTTAAFMGGTYNLGYYYYDDVKVIALCTNVPVKTVACGAPWNFDPAPLAVDRCAGSNVTVTLAGTVTNSTCPLSVSRVWTLTDACNNATNWTQTINVTGNTPFAVNCDCLMDALLGQLTTNACSGFIPLVTIPSNSPCITGGCGPLIVTQSPPPGTPVGAGQHNITLSLSKCTGVTNQCVVPFFVNAPVPTITCPPNLTVIGCSNASAIVNFAATATGHLGPIMYSPPPGSIFPMGTNTVTCTVTNSCGVTNTCSFKVIVKPPRRIWDCITKIIGIKVDLPPPVGRIIYLPDFPDGGKGVDLADFSGTEGLRFDLGPAEKFTFSTVLDFTAPTNASFELRLPPGGGTTMSTPLVRFERAPETNSAWNVRLAPQIVGDPAATFHAVAINKDGKLFNSVTVDRDALDTNIFARIELMNGATSVVMQVTLDCLTREVTLGLPNCNWTPSARHKGWDGCIYGPDKPRPAKTNKTARVIITPPAAPPLPPITDLNLTISNLATLAFDEPAITMSGRKWSDGHVTLMKAYDDGAESGMEFFADANGGGVETELGHAASFSVRLTPRDNPGLPPAEQQFAIRGWPPGTTTNRPPPPVINVRLAPDFSGLGGVNFGADFVDWGVSEVTLQLWNGTTLVGETNHVPVTPGGTLAMLAGFPGILDCPGIGVLSLSDTNPVLVLDGLNCGSTGCIGTELRVIAEPSTKFTPPTAYAGFNAAIGEDMYYLLHRLQTSPACSPIPLHVSASSDGVTLSWEGDGFHLQGAESVEGPWYDLNVESPATISAASSPRVFRLRCD